MAVKSEELCYVIRGGITYMYNSACNEEKRWEYINDRFPCGAYFRTVFNSLAVDVGGGIHSRMYLSEDGGCLKP